jgi:glycosyltransferase involved in cell wall biosynthesis
MKRILKKAPTSIQLLLPKSKNIGNVKPEISIVVPALNEELTIGEFVDWCWEGLRKAKVNGEIIIVDSSSDNTPNLALSKGAKVLRTPKKGLGQAYIDVIPYIRGDFIIMGDCDLTYDFREIKVFVDSYKKGNEFVMGSRFTGSIEDGAMPVLHRYFGTPLTTWILNRIYHSSYNDIHCGMRGLTKNALIKINLTSKGWEYASEMVLKASRMSLKIDEVPVNFFKDRDGRFSHHKRAGFWSPWFAGWINLKVMLVYSPDTFLIKPGLFALINGMLISILSVSGKASVGNIGFGLYFLLFGMAMSILGISLLQIGFLSRNSHKLRSGIERSFMEFLTYDRGMIISGLFIFAGLFLDIIFLNSYLLNGYIIHGLSRSAIFGLLLIVMGIQIFSFTLLIELKKRVGELLF